MLYSTVGGPDPGYLRKYLHFVVHPDKMARSREAMVGRQRHGLSFTHTKIVSDDDKSKHVTLTPLLRCPRIVKK